ncbi:MAG: glycosyltransferase family 2 protein [Paludibacteraceae bacterium]|nr:glycosyltransferase family 2 protein [Paludibacteraceae bacterium]
MIVINDKYEYLRGFVENLPLEFDDFGVVVYKARNEVRIGEVEGVRLCVKRFRKPNVFNSIIYSFFRKPKAQRAYENGLRLRELAIGTPEVVGYLICGENMIGESYLVTVESRLKRNFYEFRDGKIEGKEDIIREFARFSARIHKAGVLHKDYSPGNILFDNVDGRWEFEVVDINRMKFGSVNMKEACRNFGRLWGKRDFFDVIVKAYAEATGYDEGKCKCEIMKGREIFWRHRSTEHFITDESFSIGVIISTYNNPEWLEKTLWGYLAQTHKADEIIIADDGSSDETRKMIDKYFNLLPIKHIWHEDDGFRKTTILNKAVAEAESDYLIFTDQDLIPRNDFVSQHYRHARKGRFISGGAVKISRETSEQITRQDIVDGKIFSISWLTAHGTKRNGKMRKLWSNRLVCSLMNHLTTTKASWNGGNSSTWREYVLKANGFDTRMRYGAEDREFGQRLENSGIRGIQMRYSLPLIHLWHERPYVNDEDWKRNKAIWKETEKLRKTMTEYGIWKKK